MPGQWKFPPRVDRPRDRARAGVDPRHRGGVVAFEPVLQAHPAAGDVRSPQGTAQIGAAAQHRLLGLLAVRRRRIQLALRHRHLQLGAAARFGRLGDVALGGFQLGGQTVTPLAVRIEIAVDLGDALAQLFQLGAGLGLLVLFLPE
jgi:hypothetical protein